MLIIQGDGGGVGVIIRQQGCQTGRARSESNHWIFLTTRGNSQTFLCRPKLVIFHRVSEILTTKTGILRQDNIYPYCAKSSSAAIKDPSSDLTGLNETSPQTEPNQKLYIYIHMYIYLVNQGWLYVFSDSLIPAPQSDVIID